MKVAEVLRLLQDEGWHLIATRGSHRQFKHASKPGRAIIFHLDGLREDGLAVPPGASQVEYVEVAV